MLVQLALVFGPPPPGGHPEMLVPPGDGDVTVVVALSRSLPGGLPDAARALQLAVTDARTGRRVGTFLRTIPPGSEPSEAVFAVGSLPERAELALTASDASGRPVAFARGYRTRRAAAPPPLSRHVREVAVVVESGAQTLVVSYSDSTQGRFVLASGFALPPSLAWLSETADTLTLSVPEAWVVAETADTLTLVLPESLVTAETADTLTLALRPAFRPGPADS